MTIFSSTEPKFVISFTKITWKNTLLKHCNTFRSLVSAMGCFGKSCFGPESFQFVDLFDLIEDVANNN